MKVTKMVAGKDVEVPINEVWDSICKVIRLARLVAAANRPAEEQYLKIRVAFLEERLKDLENRSFILTDGGEI